MKSLRSKDTTLNAAMYIFGKYIHYIDGMVWYYTIDISLEIQMAEVAVLIVIYYKLYLVLWKKHSCEMVWCKWQQPKKFSALNRDYWTLRQNPFGWEMGKHRKS